MDMCSCKRRCPQWHSQVGEISSKDGTMILSAAAKLSNAAPKGRQIERTRRSTTAFAKRTRIPTARRQLRVSFRVITGGFRQGSRRFIWLGSLANRQILCGQPFERTRETGHRLHPSPRREVVRCDDGHAGIEASTVGRYGQCGMSRARALLYGAVPEADY